MLKALLKDMFSERATVDPNKNTQALGIANLRCKYRDEGSHLRVYVLKDDQWRGPYFLQALDLSDAL